MNSKLFLLSFILYWSSFLLTAQQSDGAAGKLNRYQASSIKALAEKIKLSHSQPQQRYEAAYQWVAHNIRYSLTESNSQSRSLSQVEITERAFLRRKAVCEGYAGLLDSLAQLMEIRTALVSGYTRLLGQIDPTPHVWLAVQLDGKWLLSDPTFGAGAMVNNKFVQEYNPDFLLVTPEKMIRSHMPYDPLWQFLASPVTHEGFILKKTHLHWKDYYRHHADSLRHFFQLDQNEQYQAEYDRLDRQPHQYEAVVLRMNFLIQALEIARHNETVKLINHISATFNEAVGAYNNYARSFNEQQRQEKGKVKLSELQKAAVLLDSCEKMLLSGRYPPELIDEAKTIQQSLFEFQQKVRDAR